MCFGTFRACPQCLLPPCSSCRGDVTCWRVSYSSTSLPASAAAACCDAGADGRWLAENSSPSPEPAGDELHQGTAHRLPVVLCGWQQAEALQRRVSTRCGGEGHRPAPPPPPPPAGWPAQCPPRGCSWWAGGGGTKDLMSPVTLQRFMLTAL